MYYTVNSKPFALNLTPKEREELEKLSLEGFVCFGEILGGATACKIEFTGEGFDLEILKPFLKKTTQKGSFVVHFEDHKGEDKYTVKFGPGFCEEN